MTSIGNFITELEKSDSKVKEYFGDCDKLIKNLKELNSVIGMAKLKGQIVKQIKTFISMKSMNIYNDKDRKHCLLLGPPGCGKTTVGKILCKIWVSIGFIGSGRRNTKINSFNKLQDELLRNQRKEINDSKQKVRESLEILTKFLAVNGSTDNCLKVLIENKSRISERDYSMLYDYLTKIKTNIDTSYAKLAIINSKKSEHLSNVQIGESSMETTKDEHLPFHCYNRNDVVSRYVGDTTHRTTKAMNEALDGVAYFDEAYNLCNDSMGMSDSYGRSALTTINQYMDEFSDRLIVVFAGYKDEIYNNLFKVQKGLESRFTQKFEIERYNSKELTQIFIQRLERSNWVLHLSNELTSLIHENMDCFEFQGRDMDTLALYTKNIMSEDVYKYILKGQKTSNIITNIDVVRKAVVIFKENMINVETSNSPNMNSLLDLLNRGS